MDKLLKTIISAAEEIKAENIRVLDLRGIASFADYLFIASASNTRQVKAIAESIDSEVTKKLKRNPIGREGESLAQWVLLDYGEVVCHLFLDEIRGFYRLEDLWFDAKPVTKAS